MYIVKARPSTSVIATKSYYTVGVTCIWMYVLHTNVYYVYLSGEWVHFSSFCNFLD